MSNRLFNGVRFGLIVSVSVVCMACSGKQVTEFEDKTPIRVIATEELSDFSREFEIEYSNFSETKASIEAQIQKLSTIERIADIELTVGLSVVTDSDDTATQEVSYVQETVKVLSKEEVASYAKAHFDSWWPVMSQDLTPPSSTLAFILPTNHHSETVPNNHYEVIQAEIKQINFLNGDKSNLSLFDDEAEEHFAIFNNFDAKVVGDLSAAITIEYPVEYTALSLSDSQPSVTVDGHNIELARLSPDQVKLTYPADVDGLLSDISGWHANGKALEQESSSAKSLPNTEALEVFETLNVHYQSSLKKLVSGDFVNIKQLQDYIVAGMPSEPNDISSVVTKNITYTGPVKEIRLVLRSKKTQTFTTLYSGVKLKLGNNQTGYFPALDTATDKYGLVDELGEWRVKPEYDHLEFTIANHFTNYMNENLLLDKEKGELVPVSYKFHEKLTPSLFSVYKVKDESENNSSRNNKGVLSNQTNQLLVPMEYSSIDVEGDWLIVEKSLPDDKKIFGVYNTKGDKILPSNHHSIKLEDDFIYASERLDPTIRSSSVFDKNGKELTPVGWRSVGYYRKDKLLLIEKCRPPKDTDTESVRYEYSQYGYSSELCEEKFIDDQGNMAISLEKFDYTYISTFSYGYAAIENKKGLWGYINTKGALVIPFKYKNVHGFHEKYTLVEAVNGDEMLIDSRQRVFKNFKDTIVHRSHGDYYNPTVYTLEDGSRYSANGERLPDAE
ncbi:WG repeat-containing protein [bacterium]|nr:WG repeat-containing protein [bacterium]